MPEDEKYTCDECGKEFSTKRGLSVHITRMHENVEDKKDDLEIMKMLEKGRKNLEEIADELNKNRERVEERIDKLMEKEWVQKQMENGKEMYYSLTETGKERVIPLMKDILDETKDFVEGVAEAFKNRLGPVMPKVEISWPKDREDED